MITAYVLFGLFRARQAGITINQDALQTAIDYLKAAPPQPAQGAANVLQALLPTSNTLQPISEWAPQPWGWVRLAFQQYVLAVEGEQNADLLAQTYEPLRNITTAAAWDM